MIKIAFIGAPSTGKSTTAEELRKISKKNVIEYISAGQTLKEYGYKINEDGTENTGKACIFFHKVSIKVLNLFSNYNDIVILPRTIIDPIAYDDVRVSEDDVKEYFKNIDYIYFLPIETPIEIRKNRTSNEEYREKIQEKLLNLIEKYNLNVKTLKGSPKEKAKSIFSNLNS